MSVFGGYNFCTEDGVKVGGAASTMHCRRLAERKANELGKPIDVFRVQGENKIYNFTVKPESAL